MILRSLHTSRPVWVSQPSVLSGTLHKNYMNLHVAVHHTVTNLEKGVWITYICHAHLFIQIYDMSVNISV